MKTKAQNISHAVMAQRFEPTDSLDNFPTPPWATRALFEHILNGYALDKQTCLEPACGAGHMAKVMTEYFQKVIASDIYPYGYGGTENYLDAKKRDLQVDWIITNPPFKRAEDFIKKSLSEAKCGVAMLTRTVFLESVGRYQRLFLTTPPSIVAQFCERVPIVKGRLDPRATTATGYAWIIWEKNSRNHTALKWIKPCRKSLERDGDYDEVYSSRTDKGSERSVISI